MIEEQCDQGTTRQLEREFLPSKQSFARARGAACGGEFQPIIKSAQAREPHRHDEREMHIARVSDVGEQEQREQDRAADQDPAHGGRVFLLLVQRIELLVVELRVVAHLEVTQSRDRLRREKDDHEKRREHRGHRAELKLGEDLDDAVEANRIKPVLESRRQDVEHSRMRFIGSRADFPAQSATSKRGRFEGHSLIQKRHQTPA